MTEHAYHLRGADNILLDVFGSRWDAGFYVSIVEEGYHYQGVPLSSVPFFPLMPLLMRLLLPLTGDAVVAGVLVANGALLLASLLFYRLVAQTWGELLAQRALWYLLIFPTAFFGSALYSESLFLLAAIGALASARRGRWGLAALFALGAGLARLMGLIVAPMLALEWLQQRQAAQQAAVAAAQSDPPASDEPAQPALPAPWAALAAILAAPVGLGAYMAYLWRTFGHALAFVHASSAWRRQPRMPGQTIAAMLQEPADGWLQALRSGTLPLNDWLDLAFVLCFLLAAFALLYRRQWAEGIFVWLGVMLGISSGLLLSQRRYVWVLFPVYVLLAQWGARPWVDRLITGLSIALLALFTALFALGYWVA